MQFLRPVINLSNNFAEKMNSTKFKLCYFPELGDTKICWFTIVVNKISMLSLVDLLLIKLWGPSDHLRECLFQSFHVVAAKKFLPTHPCGRVAATPNKTGLQPVSRTCGKTPFGFKHCRRNLDEQNWLRKFFYRVVFNGKQPSRSKLFFF